MIYFIQAGENGPIKIGRSNDVEKRLKQLQTASAEKLKILWKYDVENDKKVESELHKQLQHERIDGEWFRPSEEVLRTIKFYCCNNVSVELKNFDVKIEVQERLNQIFLSVLFENDLYRMKICDKTKKLICKKYGNEFIL